MGYKRIALFIVGSGLMLLGLFQNCKPIQSEGGSSTGNPLNSDVSLKLQGYDANGLAVSAHQEKGALIASNPNFQLDVCIYHLRFRHYYQRNPDIYDKDRATGVDLIGPIQVLSTGTPLGDYGLMDGIYNQIELGFATRYDWNPCGYSLKVKNNYGEFSTNEAIELVYKGNFEINYSTQLIEIPTQSLVDAMMEVNAEEKACDFDPNRADCIACTQNPNGPNCKTIERLIVERQLGTIFGR